VKDIRMILAVVACVMLVVIVNAEGSVSDVGPVNTDGIVSITDPDQLVGTGNSRYVKMTFGDNLEERIDGVDSVVDKGDGEYYIFFGVVVSGGVDFGGYVETDNILSNSGTPGYEAFCDGRVDLGVLPVGSSPNYALGVYDPDGGQFAQFVSSILGFDLNVSLWFMGDIEYDGVIGGITSLVIPESGDVAFSHTVLVPEPTTIAMLFIGAMAGYLRRRRRRPRLC
jgi:hypothetical protein